MRRAALLLALSLLAAPASLAQASAGGHAGHGATGGAMSPGPMSMAAMNAETLAALRPLRGRAFDLEWSRRMIDHHQMAIEMARAALANGRDSRVRQAAQAVIRDQSAEIALLRGWVQKWTGQPYTPHTMTAAPGTGASTDRWFLTEMIGHHQGAVDMGLLVPSRSGSSGVRALAQSIVKAQTAEIRSYRQWLGTVK